MNFALENKYPIDNKDQLIKAAEFFDKNLERFHPADRVKAACAMDSRASELRVNLNKNWITNYTRMEKSAKLSPDFKNSMQLRKQACIRYKVELPKIDGMEKAPAASELLDEIVKSASEFTTKDLFNTLKEFDKRAGIAYLYDNQIVDPYMTVFGSLNNAEFDGVKLAGDSTQYDLLRASRDMDKIASIKDELGGEFTDKFQKDPIRSLESLKSPEMTILSVLVR